jgi:DNA polymerase-3 subunit gamma/tau
MRDGLSLLDRLISTGAEPLTTELLEEFLGSPNSEKIYNLIGEIGDSSAAGTFAAIEDLISTGMSEVLIVDSLIEYMRDLMVVKSAGAESELLILTAEQRRRASELAEKFDTAGLIYNITALEKLRWAIKNSDTPRALLEALLLRFTLSEHFLNVDELLSQSKAGPIKKKLPVSVKGEARSEKRVTSPSRNLPAGTGNTTQEGKNSNGASNEQRAKTRSQRKNEIINDEAVKTVILGLDATITGIEEDE